MESKKTPQEVVAEAWESARLINDVSRDSHTVFIPGKQTLMLQGAILQRYLYPQGSDDDDLNEAINRHIEALSRQNPRAAYMFEHQMRVPDQQILNIGAARWYQQGLPVVRLGHKRAAALMATTVSKEVLDVAKAPFWAFFIELPDGLLHLKNDDQSLVKATGILVQVMRHTQPIEFIDGRKVPDGDLWRYAIVTDTLLTQWKINRTLEQLVQLENEVNIYEGFGIPLEDYDHRIDLLVSRLIVGVCLMMSNPENLKDKTEAALRAKNGKRPVPGSPVYHVFMEAKPINVDVRRTIKSYLGGDRDSPDVRLLVRGHWKMQPHGPGRELRKLIHVEPYWRGGEENDVIMQRIYEAGMEKP